MINNPKINKLIAKSNLFKQLDIDVIDKIKVKW